MVVEGLPTEQEIAQRHATSIARRCAQTTKEGASVWLTLLDKTRE